LRVGNGWNGRLSIAAGLPWLGEESALERHEGNYRAGYFQGLWNVEETLTHAVAWFEQPPEKRRMK